MRIRDIIRTERCEFCKTALINQKSYIARDNTSTGGFTAALCGGNEPVIYDAVDCPRCGKQRILGKRKRVYFREECIAEEPIEDQEDDNEQEAES